MSQTVSTLVAPPVVDRHVTREADLPDAAAVLPFTRQQADNPGTWIAGVVFGVVCVAAALVLIATIAVVALARTARGA